MSLPVLMKALRQLTYAEMIKLAEELDKQLQCDANNPTNVIAEVLSKLDFPEIKDAYKQEHALLKQAFSRKRSIAVKFDKGGFYAACETLPGSQVVGLDLRALFPQMLDQIVTLQALNNMK